MEVVTTVSHLIEWKYDIVIAGKGKYLARWNKEKTGKLGAAQFAKIQQRERKRRQHQIIHDWHSLSLAGQRGATNCRSRGGSGGLCQRGRVEDNGCVYVRAVVGRRGWQ